MKSKLTANPFAIQWERLNLSGLKKQLYILLIFSTGMLIFFLSVSLRHAFIPESRMILPAIQNMDLIASDRLDTYQHFRFDTYTYITGTTGKIHYKPRTLIEAIFLERIGNKTFIDYITYACVGVFIFFNVRRVNDSKSFSKHLIVVFFWSAVILFMLLPMINYLFQEFVANAFLIDGTDGQFQLDNSQGMDISPVPLFIILILLFFLKKGVDLQEEQELTV